MILRTLTLLIMLLCIGVLTSMYLVFDSIQYHGMDSAYYTLRLAIPFGMTCIAAIGGATCALALVKRWV